MADYISRYKGAQIDEGVERGLTIGKVSELKTEDKSSIVGAINEINDGLSLGRSLYTTTQPTEVTSDLPTSILNEEAKYGTGTVKVLPSNFLTKNRVIKINVKGIFSVSGSNSADIVFKLGDTVVLSAVETFDKKKTDYYFDLEIMFGAITSGQVTAQGRKLIRDDNYGSAALIPLVSTQPVSIDTTQELEIDVLFNWGDDAEGNILTAQIATIEVL